MRRRTFLTAASAAAAVATTTRAASPPRPANVIVVLADDLGYGDLGAYGARLIRTPAIDRLAQRGVRFTNFYASGNICTASRAGLMTGRYPIRTGLADQVIQATDKRGLPESELTLAELLRPTHATALVGKWHLGHVAPYWPPSRQGFDQFFGLPYSHNMEPLSLYDSGPGVELTREDVDFARLTARFFARGIQLIEQNARRPFFLMLSLTAPHVPIDPNPDHGAHSRAGDYGDVVEEIDAGVGRLMDRLRALGLERDTLVIVTSDNGPWFEGGTGPARDRKGGAGWDGGYLVPMIVHQPGRIPAGGVRDAIAMNFDLLPTILAWTGVSPPQVLLDGRDLGPLILKGGASPHETLYLFDNAQITGLRTQRWKLVDRSYYRNLRLEFSRVGITREGAMLFDLDLDRGETYSVASRHPQVFNDLLARLRRVQTEFATAAPKT